MMNIFNGLSVEDVLSKALDPPIALNVQRAVASLVEVCIDPKGSAYLLY